MAKKRLRYYQDRGATKTDEWATSYGDVVTLLLVFFVMLLGSSGVSNKKIEAISNKISGKPKTSIEEVKEKLEAIVEEQRLQDTIAIEDDPEGIDILIENRLLFASGEANLSPQAGRILRRFIKALDELPDGYRFEIEGHTDDVPIRNERFPSNWYLSSYRALVILNIFLRERFDPQKFLVQGLADTQPLVPNRDKRGNPIPANQAKNRRAVIKVR